MGVIVRVETQKERGRERGTVESYEAYNRKTSSYDCTNTTRPPIHAHRHTNSTLRIERDGERWREREKGEKKGIDEERERVVSSRKRNAAE